MKLLAPRERTTLAQKEREQAVQEGVKLAKDLSDLRKLRLEEEHKLIVFRERAFGQVKAEINVLAAEKLSIEAAIESKKEELEAYFGPLDKQWALYKNSEKKLIEADRREAQKRQEANKESGELLAAQNRLLLQEKAELAKERTEVARIQQIAEQERDRATEIKSKAQQDADSMLADIQKERESAQTLRESAQIKLQEVNTRSTALDRREKELEEREMAVLVKELQYYSPVKKAQ